VGERSVVVRESDGAGVDLSPAVVQKRKTGRGKPEMVRRTSYLKKKLRIGLPSAYHDEAVSEHSRSASLHPGKETAPRKLFYTKGLCFPRRLTGRHPQTEKVGSGRS